MSTKFFPKKWVFIRGLIRSRFHWQDFPAEFKSSFPATEVFCTELSGSGYSFTEQSPTDLDRAIEQLRDQYFEQLRDQSLAQFAGTTEPIGVIAISLGGMLATRWAEKYPAEISHLVLVNSSFKNLNPAYERLKPTNWSKMLRLIVSGHSTAIESFIVETTINDPIQRAHVLSNYVAFQKAHPIQKKNFFRQLWLSTQAVAPEKLTQRLLVLASSADRLVNPSCSKKLAEQLMAPLKIHPTAGHDLPLDDTQWILDQIRTEFISSS